MKYQKLLFSALIIVVLIAGSYLVFLVGSRFLKKESGKEISFEPAGSQGQPAIEREVDYPAPDFEITDLTGNKIKLSDYKDKTVVLNFWVTWNPACQDQLQILDAYYQEIKNSQDVALLSVDNQEDKSVVLNFINRGNYELPVFLDEKGEIGELYKLNILPLTYFINPQGRVMEKYIGILNAKELKDKVAKLSSP